jgi:hypothetical protein
MTEETSKRFPAPLASLQTGLDPKSVLICVSLFGLQAAITLSGIPYFMAKLSAHTFTAIFFLAAGLVGIMATHVTNGLVGTKTRVATSLKEDALRGAIYLGILFAVASFAAFVGL